MHTYTVHIGQFRYALYFLLQMRSCKVENVTEILEMQIKVHVPKCLKN